MLHLAILLLFLGFSNVDSKKALDQCASHVAFPNPYICGSDGFTYMNKQELSCHQRRNPRLKFGHAWKCVPENFMTPEAEVCRRMSHRKGSMVCGSDNWEYANIEQLECFQQFDPWLKSKHLGRCRKAKKAKPAIPKNKVHPNKESVSVRTRYFQ